MCAEKCNGKCSLEIPLPGMVTWEGMKADLMELPKETLVEMINMWVKNYWTLQSYWMVFVERDYGFDTATNFDMEIWEKSAKAQAGRLKNLLHLGDDTHALATALKYTAPQWPPAGFEWRFKDIGNRTLTMEVNKCPMGTYRDGKGLKLLPCKYISERLYRALAKTINPKFEVTCEHAHPDQRIEGVMCRWKFVLED